MHIQSCGPQLSKAALAAERAEEDKESLEKELASALEAAVTPPDQTVRPSLTVMPGLPTFQLH